MNFLTDIKIEQLMMTTITFAAAGVLGFWFKDVPMRIFSFVKRQCTTTLDITSAHNSFYNLMRFFEDNYAEKNFRTFKLTNGKWGNNDIATIGIGYGSHIIRFKKLFMFVNLEKESSEGTEIDKETITITKFGRSRKKFDEFFKAISVNKQRENNIQIYRMKDYWYPMSQIPKRAMNTVFLEEAKKSVVLQTIKDFTNAEKWYVDNGIPYHLGIMLYGSPGTGKSSMIKAIASYMNYDIYYLPVSNLVKLEDSMDTMPNRSIIVIEDIDCQNVLHDRSNNSGDTTASKIKAASDELSAVNFSDVLNTIDGVCSTHGRILITTTNHIEKLDPAFLRPGRIDLKIEIGFINVEILNQFLRRFFGKEVGAVFTIKEKLTCAELQNLLLQKKTYEDILAFARKDNHINGGGA